MTKDNIDYMHSVFRTIDTNTRMVGETAACVYRPGASGLVFTRSRLKMAVLRVISTRPLDYEVNIDAQDPQHPPSVPVF